MAEDWRIQVSLAGEGRTDRAEDRLETRELADDVRRELGGRVAVSRDGDELFLYADTEAAVRAAERLVRADMDEHDWNGTVTVARWHDEAEEWQPPGTPLPSSAAESAAEHARRIQDEERETAADGYASWEVRVALPSHRDARELAERLKSEGVSSVRRWKYLFVGASDEDAAEQWAQRLRSEAPAGSRVTVEGTYASVQRNNPFAIFGAATGDL